MTSNSPEQRILYILHQFGNTNRWGAVIGIALLGVFLSARAQAAAFTVDSPADPAAGDTTPGHGVCHTGAALPTCTLRAAIQEANALPGADEIILPPNTYLLTQFATLFITGNLTITGSGAATTIIDGNKSVRPNGRVLATGSGITVNISGVTIRNGGTLSDGGGILNTGTANLFNATNKSPVTGATLHCSGGGMRIKLYP